MARKAKKQAEHENHERWLITYADLITLLLVFFVIMYAMSKIDQSKFDVIARTLMFQFKSADTMLPRGSGVIGNTNPSEGGTENAKDKPVTQSDVNKLISSQSQAQLQAASQAEKEQELQQLKDKLDKYISDNNLQAQVSVKDTNKGINITLNDLLLFDLGKADLKPGAYPILQKLAEFLPTLHSMVSIEGHTDNLPLATGNPLIDNWNLSSQRALSVLRYFTDKQSLPDGMFQFVGHADTMPVVPNDNEADRQKNRRVEIIVLRDDYKPQS